MFEIEGTMCFQNDFLEVTATDNFWCGRLQCLTTNVMSEFQLQVQYYESPWQGIYYSLWNVSEENCLSGRENPRAVRFDMELPHFRVAPPRVRIWHKGREMATTHHFWFYQIGEYGPKSFHKGPRIQRCFHTKTQCMAKTRIRHTHKKKKNNNNNNRMHAVRTQKAKLVPFIHRNQCGNVGIPNSSRFTPLYKYANRYKQ